jgi:hypothetical protein
MVTFEAHPETAAAAARAAEELVSLANQHFGLTLDYTDESIRALDRLADALHKALPPESDRDKEFRESFRVYTDDVGAYLGEVLRRNHGAVWGLGTDGDAKFPAMSTLSGSIVWPIGRAQRRVENGAEDDLWYYFEALVG